MSSEAQPQQAAPANQPMSKALKTFFGVGDMTFGWLGSVENFYWNYFMTNVAMFNVEVTAAISMLVTAVDIPLSPLWGGILNSVKPGKHGRYRSWLIRMPWLLIFTYPFMFIKIGNGMIAYVMIALGAFVSHVLYALPWNSNLILVSVAGKTAEGRAALASARATWSSLGAIIFSYGAPALVVWAIAIIGPQFGYGVLAFVTAILWTLGYLVNFLLTKGREEIEAPGTSGKASKTKATRSDMIKGLFQNPHLLALLAADFPAYIFGSMLSAAAIYYFNYVAHNPGLLAVYMLASAITRTAGSYLSRQLIGKFSARLCAIIMYGVIGLSCFLGFFNYMNPIWVIGWLAFANIASGVRTATEPVLFGDAAVYSQWKTGADSRGWVMGLSVIPIKISFMVRSLIFNLVLGLVGFNAAIPASEATPELQRGISMALLLIPGALILLGMLILIFGYRLTRSMVAQYQNEINAKQA